MNTVDFRPPLGCWSFRPKPNTVLWISISTREQDYFQAVASPRPDGYIILIDEKGPRIVGDGICITNEIRMDAEEQYLYVVETMKCRIETILSGQDENTFWY